MSGDMEFGKGYRIGVIALCSMYLYTLKNQLYLLCFEKSTFFPVDT